MLNKKFLLVMCSVFSLVACTTNAETIPVQNQKDDNEKVEETTSFKSNMDTDKSEIVHAKAKTNGNIYETKVDVSLRNNHAEAITDTTNLSDIRNTKGDEVYTLEGNTLIWENKGEDISYNGKSEEPLPIQTTITYKLDGKDVTSEDLVNKSGNVEITYQFQNITDPVVPFAVMTVLALDTDEFSNVKVNHGKVISLDDSLIVLGYALPNIEEELNLKSLDLTDDIDEIPSSVTITCDTTNFTLDFSSIVFTNGLLKDEGNKDSLKDITDSINDLQNATKDIVDGTGDLFDGVTSYQEYTGQFHEALIKLKDGSKTLKDALNTMNTQKSSLIQGISVLDTGISGVDSSLSALIEATSNNENTSAIEEAKNVVLAQVQIIQNAMTSLQADLVNLTNYASELNTAKDSINEKIAESNTKIDAINQHLNSEKDSVIQKINNNQDLTDDQKTALISEIENCFVESDALDNIDISISDTPTITTDISTADTTSLTNSISTLMTNALFTSSLKEIQKGASELALVAKSLNDGSSILSDGIGQLSTGADSLYSGIDAIVTAHKEMSDGLDELASGLLKLKEGVEEYKEKGIDKLSDISILADRIDALKDADNSYDGYSTHAENTSIETVFIVETDSIK